MESKSNWQDFLKVIAIVAMVVDHLGLYFFPDNLLLRMIGRVSMPLFCFFAGYNFKGRPNRNVLSYGLLMYSCSVILFQVFTRANILISIYLGFWYIYVFKNSLQSFYSSYTHVIVLGLLCPFTSQITDYSTLAIAIMILGYMTKHNQSNVTLMSAASFILSLFYTVTAFKPNLLYTIVELIILVIVYYLMVKYDFKKTINIRLDILSRNILIIYFGHVVIMQLIFYAIAMLRAHQFLY